MSRRRAPCVRARAAARAVQCGRGDVEWAARSAGSTPSAARAAIGHGDGRWPRARPRTTALTDGSLSLAQAQEIVRAEAAVPGSEHALLEVASTQGMAGLRAEARRVVLGSIDRDELHRRQCGGAVGAALGRRRRDGGGPVPVAAGGGRAVRATDSTARPIAATGPRAGRSTWSHGRRTRADALVLLTKGGGQGSSRSGRRRVRVRSAGCGAWAHPW